MTAARALVVEAIAFWSPEWPDWARARAAFAVDSAAGPAAVPAGSDPPDLSPAKACRPAPALLPPAERRRAPDTVALALEVASVAVAQSGRPADELLSVFTSCHGDLAITDAMCTQLAGHPELLSPTRFHNSVHNAASGYWGIATGCTQPSTAISAYRHSFAAGLLEATTQAAADGRAVLLVGYGIEACGALAATTESEGRFAVALVLAPSPGARGLATLACTLAPQRPAQALPSDPAPPTLRSAAGRALAGNGMADALPLLEALARTEPTALRLPLSQALALALTVAPPAEHAACTRLPPGASDEIER